MFNVQPALLGAAPANARNMATLREVELRLEPVRKIIVRSVFKENRKEVANFLCSR